jgi:hypothetical protein
MILRGHITYQEKDNFNAIPKIKLKKTLWALVIFEISSSEEPSLETFDATDTPSAYANLLIVKSDHFTHRLQITCSTLKCHQVKTCFKASKLPVDSSGKYELFKILGPYITFQATWHCRIDRSDFHFLPVIYPKLSVSQKNHEKLSVKKKKSKKWLCGKTCLEKLYYGLKFQKDRIKIS